MMNKKGFTLVELLAVIAILAILILIALPNVMSLFNEAKANSFTTELKNIYKSAQQQWMRDSMFDTNERVYARYNNGNCANELKLSGRNNIEYYIKINKGGKVIEYYATDGTYQYSYKGNDLEVENIKDVKEISKITNGRLVSVSCTGGRVASPEPASANDYLMAGTSGGATSNYLRTTIKKENIEKITFTDSIEGHTPNGTDCWDVSSGRKGTVLLWATDTDNNGLYELTIGANGEVYASSGSYLFRNMINLKSINGIENLNTSKATEMDSMFRSCEKLESIDLSYFDTSNVTDMSYMFKGCHNLTNLDLSNFDTSEVTNMSAMFAECGKLKNVNLSSFNTSKVTNMSAMFEGQLVETYNVGNGAVVYYEIWGELTNLDLSNFDTSNVTRMDYMFSRQYKLRNINFGNWNTSKLENMNEMFQGCLNLETIDLSSFDTSKVKNMYRMFSLLLEVHADSETGYSMEGEVFYSISRSGVNQSNHPNMRVKTIYASDNFLTSSVTYSSEMFNFTPNLVGGSGTTYSEDHKDSTYAHIDGGPSNPGYFTRK